MEQKAMAVGCRCRRDEPMARHTTFKIGGPADLLVTAEDGVVAGGAGSGVLEVLSDHGIDVDTMLFGIGDHFVGQGSVEELMKENGLDNESVLAAIEKRLEKHAA